MYNGRKALTGWAARCRTEAESSSEAKISPPTRSQ